MSCKTGTSVFLRSVATSGTTSASECGCGTRASWSRWTAASSSHAGSGTTHSGSSARTPPRLRRQVLVHQLVIEIQESIFYFCFDFMPQFYAYFSDLFEKLFCQLVCQALKCSDSDCRNVELFLLWILLECAFNSHLCVKVFPHSEHTWFLFFSCTPATCVLKLSFRVVEKGHFSHWNIFPPTLCTVLSCLFK